MYSFPSLFFYLCCCDYVLHWTLFWPYRFCCYFTEFFFCPFSFCQLSYDMFQQISKSTLKNWICTWKESKSVWKFESWTVVLEIDSGCVVPVKTVSFLVVSENVLMLIRGLCHGFDLRLGRIFPVEEIFPLELTRVWLHSPKTLSDESINRVLVCAYMHSVAQTQKILTFMS